MERIYFPRKVQANVTNNVYPFGEDCSAVVWCAGEQESELLELFFTTIITQKNGNETGSRPNSELIKGGSFH